MSSRTSSKDLCRSCLRLLIRPIVTFAVSKAITFQEFVDMTREVFIEAAQDAIRKRDEKITLGKIGVITGLARQQISKVLDQSASDTPSGESVSARVIAQWEQVGQFRTQGGKPKILSYEGPESDFYQLVETVNKHLDPRTVLFDLERTETVKRTSRGLKLLESVGDTSRDPVETYETIAKDISTIIEVAENNIQTPPNTTPHHHLRTEYDNLYLKDLPYIKEWLFDEGRALHKRARDFLSQYDKDVSRIKMKIGEPEPPAGGRVVITAFSFTEE